MPISIFLGWGFDREPSGVVQASGRTARGSGEGHVVWVHNPSLHIPTSSRQISWAEAERQGYLPPKKQASVIWGRGDA